MMESSANLINSKELIIILGPTGVGKTDYSIELAKKLQSPIINCDSRQIFKELKIGTAAPSVEQLEQVKHYFIYSNSVSEYYTAGRYEIEALDLLNQLFIKHDKLVMVGGSGLYIDALCNGLDDFPEADQDLRAQLSLKCQNEGLESLSKELQLRDIDSYNSIELSNKQRVIRALEVTIQTGKKFSEWKSATKKSRPFKITKIGLNRDREILYNRINKRVDNMIEDGLVAEVASLQEYRYMPALNTVGYKELFAYLDGDSSLENAVELIKRNSRRYAKRQITYWGRDADIKWLELS